MKYTRLKYWIITGILLQSFIVSGQFSSDTLTIEELIDWAVDYSLDKELATLNLEESQYNYRIFKANLKPQLSLIANLPNYAKSFAEITQPDGTVQFQSISNNNSIAALSLSQAIPQTGGTLFMTSNIQRFDDFDRNTKFYNGNPFRIGISQPLFGYNPHKWNKKIVSLQQQTANRQYQLDLANIRLKAAQLFFDLLIAHQNVSIAVTNKKANADLLRIAKERFEMGNISEADLKQLELGWMAARKEEQSANRAFRLASSVIFSWIGQPDSGKVIYPRLGKKMDALNITEQEALIQARKNHPHLLTQESLVLESQQALEKAKKTNRFQADLTASIGWARGDQDLETIYSDPKQEQFLSLNLNIPIMDWGKRKQAVKFAKLEHAYNQKAIHQAQWTLETAVKVTVEQLYQLQEELDLSKDMKYIANQRFDIIRESYVLGAINIIELTLAQNEKDQAERTYISTLRDFKLTYYQLKTLTLK